MEPCPFCHVKPERVVAETGLTLTIRHGFPVTSGHTPVIPRRHFANFFDSNGAEVAEIWLARRLAAAELTRQVQAPQVPESLWAPPPVGR